VILGRRPFIAVAFAAAAAAAAVFTAAAGADRERVHIVAADQKLAKNALVRLTDLGNPAGWTGGETTAQSPSSFTCGTYTAKQSDLVLTGNAASKWVHSGLEIDSEAQVLRTSGMVALDWQRTVTHAGVVACLKRQFASGLPKGQKLVSFRPVSFPKIAERSAAFRGLVDVDTGNATVRVLVDVVVVGAGRMELTLITTAPYAARAPVKTAETRLAQLLAARAQPGSA
jgi:hypothetical protein